MDFFDNPDQAEDDRIEALAADVAALKPKTYVRSLIDRETKAKLDDKKSTKILSYEDKLHAQKLLRDQKRVGLIDDTGKVPGVLRLNELKQNTLKIHGSAQTTERGGFSADQFDPNNYKPGLRRVKESTLNHLLDTLPEEDVFKLIRKPLPAYLTKSLVNIKKIQTQKSNDDPAANGETNGKSISNKKSFDDFFDYDRDFFTVARSVNRYVYKENRKKRNNRDFNYDEICDIDDKYHNDRSKRSTYDILSSMARKNEIKIPPTASETDVASNDDKEVELGIAMYDRISPAVTRIIERTALLDEPNLERRAHTFIGYCRCRNFAFNTTIAYFRQARQIGLFGPLCTIYPDRTTFQNHRHCRLDDPKSFSRYIEYLHKTFSKYNAPLLLGYYGALRPSEVVLMNTLVLHQLLNNARVVDIKLKNTTANNVRYWNPKYTSLLQSFINRLCDLYRVEYDDYLNKNRNVPLFNISPGTLLDRMHNSYYKANGFAPPPGFGIHGQRTMIASHMYKTNRNLVAISKFLQHKNLRTTKRYIKTNIKDMTRQFNRATSKAYSGILEQLSKPTNTSTESKK